MDKLTKAIKKRQQAETMAILLSFAFIAAAVVLVFIVI